LWYSCFCFLQPRT